MIRRFLDASTANLTPQTCQRITDGKLGTAYQHPEGCGLFLHVPDAETLAHLDWPEDLRGVLSYAAEWGCDYVCFDRDAEKVERLPDYSDQWEAADA